jgi:uncharacterized protein
MFYDMLSPVAQGENMISRTNSSKKNGLLPLIAAFLLSAVVLASCSAQTAKAQDPNQPNPKLKTVTLSVGSVQVKAEVADTELKRNRGLMFRKNLADGAGMLFVFDSDQRVSFWMKNTSLPLSIAFIGSDGTIYQILDMAPFSEEPRPSDRSVRYALEAPQGWFGRAGVKVGDKFDIPALK